MLLDRPCQYGKKVSYVEFRNKYTFVKNSKQFTLVHLTLKKVYEDHIKIKEEKEKIKNKKQKKIIKKKGVQKKEENK